MESKELKQNIFDKEFRALFEHLRNIIKTRDAGRLKMGNGINPILKYLNKYEKLYTHPESDPDDHKDFVLNVLNKYRGQILKGHKNDGWVKSGSVAIQFGEGCANVDKEYRIMLSATYNTATQLCEDAKKRLDGLPDAAYEECHELNYPDIFMLHLYRLFREVAVDKNDKEKLAACVNDIETDLGIESDTPVESQQGGFSGMMSMATGFLSQMGLQVPKDMKPPSEKELMGAMGGLLSNPQLKETIGSIFTDIQKDPKQVLQKLAGALGNPEVTEAISGTFENATQTFAPQIEGPTAPVASSPGSSMTPVEAAAGAVTTPVAAPMVASKTPKVPIEPSLD